MSERIVNALHDMKRVYVEKVSNNNYQQEILDEQMRQIVEFKKPKLDPSKKDIDGDGDVDKSDSYLHKRSDSIEINQILNAIKKWKKSGTPNSDESADNLEKVMRAISPPVRENCYYSWRDTIDENTLLEIIQSEEENQVKEKKVNNYSGKNPVVEVNPEIKTESVLIDSEELDEDFIEESIDIATEYLCEEGLSAEDVEDLINELGVEEFSEWVVQLGYETLILYERRLGPGETSLPAKTRERLGAKVSRTPESNLKGGAQITKRRSDDARRKARSDARQMPEPTERQKRLSTLLAKQKTVNSSSNPEVKRMVRGALDAVARVGLSAWEGHKKAMETKKEGGSLAKQLGGGASAAIRSLIKKGTSHFKEWVENLLEEGYDLSEYTWEELYEEYEDLQEKAVSEQQQKLFGLALSVKRGETPRSKASKEVLDIVDSMSESQIRKYAKTSHEGIPEVKKELAEKVIQFVRENN